MFFKFLDQFFLVGLFLTMPCKTISKEKLWVTWHNIQKKTHIHIFHYRLQGEVSIILELFLNFNDSIRIALTVMCAKLTLTKNFDIKTSTK